MAEMNTYDEVAYPGFPFRQSHPDRMAVVAQLLGMAPAPASRCRVLELGCGDGGNLIPMACGLPSSEFVGVDLAARAVAKGQALAEELRLQNVRLLAMDLSDVGPEFGEFDYIIAFGVYSWVPEPVRARMLDIVRTHLAPQGVAYINYNAFPGGHVRTMIREMMLYHVRGISGPPERIAGAQELLRLLSGSPALEHEYGAVIKAEAERLLARNGAVLFHDELASEYRPFWFHEFAARAGAQGLQYLAEATLSDTHALSGPDAGWLAAIPDVVSREQHLDFVKYRSFRHTLLCRREVPLDRTLRPAAVRNLWAACSARVSEAEGETEFKTSRATLRTAHPVAVGVLSALAELWPEAVPVSDIVERAGGEDGAAITCSILLRAFTGEIAELYGTPPCVAAVPGDRPAASPLARIQARDGETVSTLLHTYVAVHDETARKLLGLLDGTRDRAMLLRELSVPGADPSKLSAGLEQSLTALARLGLLMP